MEGNAPCVCRLMHVCADPVCLCVHALGMEEKKGWHTHPNSPFFVCLFVPASTSVVLQPMQCWYFISFKSFLPYFARCFLRGVRTQLAARLALAAAWAGWWQWCGTVGSPKCSRDTGTEPSPGAGSAGSVTARVPAGLRPHPSTARAVLHRSRSFRKAPA